jgi:hypothetical protein
MILPEIWNSLRSKPEREEIEVNPLKDNTWQYMHHNGAIYNRHENHVIVNNDGIVTWKEFSAICETPCLQYVSATLEESINDMVGNGLIEHGLDNDPVAQEALNTLALSLAANTKTQVHEMNATIEDCIFTYLECSDCQCGEGCCGQH